MSGLSESDKADLMSIRGIPTWCDCGDSYCSIRARMTKAVEQIVQRHVEEAVAAFKAEAVAAIEAGVLPSHPNGGYRDGFARSAQIVRECPT